jgi:hypothetical protein
MVATELDIVTVTSRNPSDDGGDTVEWVTADDTNGNRFRSTGRETLLAQNVSEDGALTLTIASVADSHGRTQDIERLIESGETVAFELGVDGWRDDDGYVQIESESDDILLAVIRRPAR